MMDFSRALACLKQGDLVARTGWNGKAMWLRLVDPADYRVIGETRTLLPWIGMKTAGDEFVPWLASQTDLLADDWTRVRTA